MLKKSYILKSKTMLMVFFSVGLLQGCGEKIDARQIQDIQGLVYKINASDPFTGTVTNYAPSNFKVFVQGGCDVSVEKGVFEGVTSCALENGTKFLEVSFSHGKENGELKQWNGSTKKLVLRVQFVNGVKEGIEERYNPESGAMIRQVHWSSNQKVGEQKIWNSSGDVLLTDLIWDGGRAESGFEKSGEHENIYKDGRYEGSQKNYEWHGDYNKYALAKATAEQYGADYFIPLLGAPSVDYSISEVVYKDGKKVEAPLTAEAQKELDACIQTRIDMIRSVQGADYVIPNDALEELKQGCTTH